jgi:periplasmic divalent cation tolerance protein
MTDLVLVLTTVPAGGAGATIARTLVEERLAACVNLLPPMTSVYRWQGAISQDPEQQLIAKTRRDLVSRLEDRLRELHPYDLPEFLVVDVGGGSAGYLEWVRENTTGGGTG